MNGVIILRKRFAYCGIDCAACPACIATLSGDTAKRAELAREWSHEKCTFTPEEIQCTGCDHCSWKMTEPCEIRRCAMKRKHTTCAACEDYPCARFQDERLKEPIANLDALKTAILLVKTSPIAYLASINQDGYPNMKAMLNLEPEGLESLWFSTNTPSQRVGQFRQNPKASVYFCDHSRYLGLMLVGEIEVREDQASKERLWRDGFERYYPRGVTDPDYCVLKFSSLYADLYHGGKYLIRFETKKPNEVVNPWDVA